VFFFFFFNKFHFYFLLVLWNKKKKNERESKTDIKRERASKKYTHAKCWRKKRTSKIQILFLPSFLFLENTHIYRLEVIREYFTFINYTEIHHLYVCMSIKVLSYSYPKKTSTGVFMYDKQIFRWKGGCI